MPDWKTHFIFGLLLLIAWLASFQVIWISNLLQNAGLHPNSMPDLVILLALTMVASLFPDIDIGKSKVRNMASLSVATLASIVYVIIFPYNWFYGPVYFVLLYLISRYFPTKHRGITHTFKFSLVFSAAVAILLGFFDPMPQRMFFWALICLAGYDLHLALDGM